MGKSTISMAIFNSYFDITRGYEHQKNQQCSPSTGTTFMMTPGFDFSGFRRVFCRVDHIHKAHQSQLPRFSIARFWLQKVINQSWLVVYLPLWEIWKSVGMIIPNIWKSKIDVPNHQPDSHCIPLSFRIIPFKLPQVRWIDGSSLRWIDSQRLTGSIGWCFGLVVWNPRISLAEHRYGLSQEPPTQTILEEPVEFWHSQCIYIYICIHMYIYIHYTYISLHMYIYIYICMWNIIHRT